MSEKTPFQSKLEKILKKQKLLQSSEYDDDFDEFENSRDLNDVVFNSRYKLYGMLFKNVKMKKIQDPKSILDQKSIFPPFCMLPNKTELFEDYHASDGSSSIYGLRNSWMFIGEISIPNYFVRPRCVLKMGFNTMSSLLSNNGGSDTRCGFIPNGSVMLILHAEIHGFMDMSLGFRIEDRHLSYVSVIKGCSLKLFQEICKKYFKGNFEILSKRKWSNDNTQIGGLVQWKLCKRTKCDLCGKGGKLLRCAKCKRANYCGKKCQVKDWKKRHKKECEFVSIIEDEIITFYMEKNFVSENIM